MWVYHAPEGCPIARERDDGTFEEYPHRHCWLMLREEQLWALVAEASPADLVKASVDEGRQSQFADNGFQGPEGLTVEDFVYEMLRAQYACYRKAMPRLEGATRTRG